MKTPHLATALLAASAMMAGSSATASDMPLRFDIKSMPKTLAPIMPNTRSGGGRRRFEPRTGGSQRQLRKDRRRFHAAGGRNAFA